MSQIRIRLGTLIENLKQCKAPDGYSSLVRACDNFNKQLLKYSESKRASNSKRFRYYVLNAKKTKRLAKVVKKATKATQTTYKLGRFEPDF